MPRKNRSLVRMAYKSKFFISLAVFALVLLFSVQFIQATTFSQSQAQNLTTSCDGFACAELNVTILYPNHTALAFNQSMTTLNSYAYYEFTPETIGDYMVYYYDGGNYSNETITVTTSGDTINTPKSIVYLGLIAILFVLWAMSLLATKLYSNKYYKMTIALISYGLLIGLLFIMSNVATAYLGSNMMGKYLFTLFTIAFSLAPVVVILAFIWIFYNLMTDREMKRMIERGVDAGGNI